MIEPKPPSKSVLRKAMRDRGYQHGMDGSPPNSSEPEYLTSYRRGKERRLAIDNKGEDDDDQHRIPVQ